MKVLVSLQTRLEPIRFPFCYLCFMSVMLSCLLFAALWSPAEKGLASWLSCV